MATLWLGLSSLRVWIFVLDPCKCAVTQLFDIPLFLELNSQV